MNRYLPSSLPYQINAPGSNSFMPRNGLNPYTGVSLPAHLPMQSAMSEVNKLQLSLLHQQFMQNYTFSNSEGYHPSAAEQYMKSAKGQSNTNLCQIIKQDILQRLNGTGASNVTSTVDGSSATPGESQESSPDTSIQSNTASIAHIMEARGVKRTSDLQKSPQKKKSRCVEGYSHDCPVPMNYPNRNNEIESITQVIWQYFVESRQSQELYQRKMWLRDALFTVMKGVFPYCGLYVVGSSMNGFGNQNSDMDICLMLSQTEIDQKKEASELLRIIYKSLHKCSFLRELNLIRAKVPILKFQDKISGVECDLNINNSVGIRNTHLLNAYSKLDWRVAPLVLFVKNWAKIHNINDASKGTISSYSLVLMVIHYLQYGCNPAVIPSLQQKYPNKFNVHLDIRLLTLNDKQPVYVSSNHQSLGELFIGFLNYYANVFNFDEDAISIRLGTKIARNIVVQQNPGKNPPNQWKCICIEEPFDLSNTARSVYDSYVFQSIERVIRSSFTRLRKTGNIHSILDQPL